MNLNNDSMFSVLSYLDLKAIGRFSQVSLKTRENSNDFLNFQFNTFLNYGHQKRFNSLDLPTLQSKVFRIWCTIKVLIEGNSEQKLEGNSEQKQKSSLLGQLKPVFKLFEIFYRTAEPSMQAEIEELNCSSFILELNKVTREDLKSQKNLSIMYDVEKVYWIFNKLEIVHLTEKDQNLKTIMKEIGSEEFPVGFFIRLSFGNEQVFGIYFVRIEKDVVEKTICELDQFADDFIEEDSWEQRWKQLKAIHDQHFQKSEENKNPFTLSLADLRHNRLKLDFVRI